MKRPKVTNRAEADARAVYAAHRRKEGAKFQEIADELGVHKERAREIVARGERLLREQAKFGGLSELLRVGRTIEMQLPINQLNEVYSRREQHDRDMEALSIALGAVHVDASLGNRGMIPVILTGRN